MARTRTGSSIRAEFISLAEETGLIVPISRFVLGEACRQAIEWMGPSGSPMYLAVNVSATQLEGGSVARDVRAALRKSGLDPSSLVIEITESTLIDDSRRRRASCGSFASSACVWRSTTSAPATRRSAACGGFRSTS